jgi:ribonuclease HI
VETVEHIFLDCEWAKKVWFSSPLTIRTENRQIKQFPNWLDHMIQETKPEELQIISTILYSIWLARNDREFKGKSLPPIEMVQRASKNLQEYQSYQHARNPVNPIDPEYHRHNTSWSLPPKDALKLNVDAHSMGDGRWGLGLLLRRDDGSCVGAATRIRKGSTCAILAEAMGLQEALDLVNRWNLCNTIIEMDAKMIVDAVHSRTRPRTFWGKIVDSCVKKMKNRSGIKVSWMRRAGNKAAHELARWAAYEPNKEWISNFPNCINSHIQKDMDSNFPV